MGLFDFLKPKKTELEKTMEELDKNLFPGGNKQKMVGGQKILKITGPKFDLPTAVNIYVKAKVRFEISEDKTPDRHIPSIMIDAGQKISKNEAEKIFESVVLEKIGFSDNSGEEDDLAAALMAGMMGIGNKGYDLDEIPGGYGEFGLTKTNPVPVKGIISNEIYLKRLRAPEGNPITWKRLGSTGAPNIEESIDIYEIKNSYGQVISTIYISPYHKRISNKAPRGFRFGS